MMFLMTGFTPDVLVVVVVVTVVVDTVAVVGGTVGVRTGMEDGTLLVTFSVYIFSNTFRLYFSV
jgi:hypothetical protein